MNKLYFLKALLLLTGGLICIHGFAQLPGTWTFNQGCNGFSGACSGSGIYQSPAGTYHLTDYGSKTTTSMWNNTVFSLENPFRIQFDVRFGNYAETQTPPVGGEGIAFGLQSVWGTGGQLTHSTSPAATQLTSGGYGGGDLGMKCLQSGGANAFPNNTSPANARTISVEWDVFDNTNGAGCTGGCMHGGDLAQDHMSVNYDDCSATSSNGTLGAATPALAGGADLTDGVWRTAIIEWTPGPWVVLGTKYDRYVSATDCTLPGTFVDQCGNVVAWSSTTCGANRNCNVMAINTGTLRVTFNGVVKYNITLNIEQLLNENQGINGRNIRRDVILGFTASTEGKTNDQWIRNPTLTILPVTFTSFNTIKTSYSSVKLNWSTSEERNSSHFIIQRSEDGINWTDAGKVNAAGNTSLTSLYSFNDSRLRSAYYYYRLKEVDLDGTTQYSHISTVDLSSENIIVEIYPNPVKGGDKLNITSCEKIESGELYDMTGKLIRSFNLSSGEKEFSLETENLNKGIYLVKVKTENSGLVIKKVSVVK
jgi:hypothetical protein